MNSVSAASPPRLRPYHGSHRILPDGCPKVLSTFTSDTSARVSYAFNSLGFRGDEFDATAARHLFVSGCSVTFGLGLAYTDAWVSIFRQGYATIHRVSESSVNLQNFASSGCSNGYITRSLIDQSQRFRPTLALALLTFADRAELLHGGRSYNIGRWCLLDSFGAGAEADGHLVELRQMIRRHAQAYYDLHTPLSGDQEVLKNALLLQLYFDTRRIPCLIGIIRTGGGALPSHELFESWTDCLDSARVFSISARQYLVDESAAPGHPGPAGSRVIASAFLDRYKSLLTGRSQASAGAHHGVQLPAEIGDHPGADRSSAPDSNVYTLF